MKLKKFAVDMTALNIFVLATAFIVEVVISQVAWSVFWKGRIIMILPNILTAQPYSTARIWLGEKLSGIQNIRVRNILRDTIVFILFRVPLIFIVLLLLGAPTGKIISACIAATAISGFTGRPYGIFLDWIRKKFGVS